jgi:hypothetical protein
MEMNHGAWLGGAPYRLITKPTSGIVLPRPAPANAPKNQMVRISAHPTGASSLTTPFSCVPLIASEISIVSSAPFVDDALDYRR